MNARIAERGLDYQAEPPRAPSYSTNDPRGWCGDPKRGAAMGRGAQHDADPELPIKLYLQRIYLDSGGYDRNGTYFGFGEPLYWYADSDGTVDAMLRARSRAEAKLKILERYSKARFFR